MKRAKRKIERNTEKKEMAGCLRRNLGKLWKEAGEAKKKPEKMPCKNEMNITLRHLHILKTWPPLHPPFTTTMI